MSGDIAVDIRNVAKSYGTVTALADTSLTVRRGEFMTLLGPSGCGKTTLLYLIAGFIPADAGDVFIGGERVTDMPPNKRNIGVVFQNYALFPHMSVADNVAFGLKMRKLKAVEARERVRETLEIVKLAGMESRLPRELSGGQQQRVALARALVIRPRVLLLDEPLSALDKNLRAQMQIELREIQRRIGVTTIFVTHDQGEALTLSDRIAVMAHGTVQQVSEPMEVYRRPRNGFVASFIGDINALGGKVVSADESGAVIEIAGAGRIALPAGACRAARRGDSVTVFVRPESLRPPAPAETALLAGKVINHVYQGSFVDVYLRAAPGNLHLRTLGHEALERYPVDSEIALAVDPKDVVVLPETRAAEA